MASGGPGSVEPLRKEKRRVRLTAISLFSKRPVSRRVVEVQTLNAEPNGVNLVGVGEGWTP
jgi:hypothetical protein